MCTCSIGNNPSFSQLPIYPPYPGTPLSVGSSGSNVSLMQSYLNFLRQYHPTLNKLVVDGKFGNATKQTVMQYQAINTLKVDGIIGQITWNAIVSEYNSYNPSGPDTYPGTPLKSGSSGAYVSHMQTALNICSTVYTVINKLTVDGKFGSNTTLATKRFQEQFGLSVDGVIGQNTWNKIVEVRNSITARNPEKVSTKYPGSPVKQGDSGENVRVVQHYINTINKRLGYVWATLTEDNSFGNATRNAVIAFQGYFGLKIDGIVGSNTWSAMVMQYNLSI